MMFRTMLNAANKIHGYNNKMVKSARIQSRRQVRNLRSKLKTDRNKKCFNAPETIANLPITMRQIDFSNFKLSSSTSTVVGEISPFSVPHSKPKLSLESFRQITIDDCRSQSESTAAASTYATSNNTSQCIPRLMSEKSTCNGIERRRDYTPPNNRLDAEKTSIFVSAEDEEDALAAAVIRRTMKKDPKLRATIVKMMRKYGYYKFPGDCIKHMNSLMPKFTYNKGVISADMDSMNSISRIYPNIIDHTHDTPLRVDESVMDMVFRPCDYHIPDNEAERLTSVDRIKKRVVIPNVSFNSRTIVVLHRKGRKHTVIAFNRSLLLDSYYQLDRFYDNKPIFWAMNNFDFEIITSHLSNNQELISEVGAIIFGLTPETLSDRQLIDIWTCIPPERIVVGGIHPKSGLDLPGNKKSHTQIMRYERFAVSTAEMPAELAFMLVENMEETEYIMKFALPEDYVCNKAIMKKAFSGLYASLNRLGNINVKDYILPLIIILAVERPLIFDNRYLFDIIKKDINSPPEIVFRNQYLQKNVHPDHKEEFIELVSNYYYKYKYNPDSMFRFIPQLRSKYRKEMPIYLDRSYMIETVQRFIRFVKKSRLERAKLASLDNLKKVKKDESLKLDCYLLKPEDPYAYIDFDKPYDINAAHPIALCISEISEMVEMQFDYHVVDKIDCKGLVFKPYIRNVIETSEFRLPSLIIDVLSNLFANKKAGSNKYMTKTNSFVLGEFKEYVLTMRRYRYLYNTTSTAGSSNLNLKEEEIKIENQRVCLDGIQAYMSSEFYSQASSHPVPDTVHIRVCNYLCSRLYILLYHINFPHYFSDQANIGYSQGSKIFTDLSRVKSYLNTKIYKGTRLDRHAWGLYLDNDIRFLKSVVFVGDYTIESMPIFDITDDPNDEENIFYYPIIEVSMNENPKEYKNILENVMKEEYINQQFLKHNRIRDVNHKMTLNRLYYLLHISKCLTELNSRCRYLVDPAKRKFTVQYNMHQKDHDYLTLMKKAYNASCFRDNSKIVSSAIDHEFTYFITSTDVGNLETRRHITREEFLMLRQDYQRILLFTINISLDIFKKHSHSKQRKLLHKIETYEWSFWLMNHRVREDTIEYLKDKHWKIYVKERLKIIDEKCIEYYLYIKNKKLKSGARWTADTLIQEIRKKSNIHLTRDYDWEFYDEHPRLMEEVKKLYDEKVKFSNEYYHLANKYAKGNPKACMAVMSYKNLLKYARRTLKLKPFKITTEEVLEYMTKKGYDTEKYEKKSNLYLRSLFNPDSFFMRGVFIHKTIQSPNRFINIILSDSLSLRRWAKDIITPTFKALTCNPFKSMINNNSLDPEASLAGRIDTRKEPEESVVVYNETEMMMLDSLALFIEKYLPGLEENTGEMTTLKTSSMV